MKDCPIFPSLKIKIGLHLGSLLSCCIRFKIAVFANFVILRQHGVFTNGPLGGKFDFFSPLRFEIQSDFDYKTSKNQALLSQSFETLSE